MAPADTAEVTTDTDGDARVSADLLPGNNELGRSPVVRCDTSTIRVSITGRDPFTLGDGARAGCVMLTRISRKMWLVGIAIVGYMLGTLAETHWI